jgi:glyoxylase-like metal-dependent hydrolase (beta-lactamase superfamily II)
LRFGKFDLSIIRECVFKLDGGAMFGVVPKALWSKTTPSDEDNRVVLACNLLLIDTGDKKVLIETGMGDRWSDKERERYGLKSLVSSATVLDQVNLKPEDIDFVVISHLAF